MSGVASTPVILLIGTCDTKSEEMLFMRDCLRQGGGEALLMDVGILGQAAIATELDSAAVAAAAGYRLEDLAALGDENLAMTRMAAGAARLAMQLYADGRIAAMVSMGGTMGTDLALDVAAALPLGVPKMIVSTVSFSHLVPPERIAADLMMILWAGGLYGLNSVCAGVLRQAAGAILGACRASAPPARTRPLVGMTSLGKSCLNYMVTLKPALEQRGYEVAVFHSTGMGGRAFEALAAQGRFAAVLDLSLQEVSNEVNGSVVNSGPTRLEAAGRAGTPQIVAPGAADMIDLPSWQPLPERYAGRPYHAHNRLIGSVIASSEERRRTAANIATKLERADGPTAFVLPLHGVQQWDRAGQPLHAPESHAALVDELRRRLRPPVQLCELDAHINDPAFAAEVLNIFDAWVSRGIVPPGETRP